MAQISSFLRDAGALFTNLFLQPDWRNVFDVAIMTVIIYYIIKLLIHTRASAVFKGIAVVLVFAWVSDVLQLNALNWMCEQEDAVSIRPKSLSTEYLTVPSADASTWSLILVAVIPLALLACGAYVTVTRRKR